MEELREQTDKLLIKADEAAAMLSLSPRTLWSLTKSGDIPSLKIGKAVRYAVADLQRWIEATKAGKPETIATPPADIGNGNADAAKDRGWF